MPNRGVYNIEPGTAIDHNYNHNMNNMNHEFHHFNTGKLPFVSNKIYM